MTAYIKVEHAKVEHAKVKHALFMAGCMLAAQNANAGTYSPIDIGQLVFVVVLYFLGLLGCLVMMIVSRRRGLWLSLLIGGIGIPIVVFNVGHAIRKNKQAQQHEENQQGMMKNALAFKAYCKGRQRNVRAKVSIPSGSALGIQIEDNFPGSVASFNASPMRGYMTQIRQARSSQPWCERSNFSYLVGRYDHDLVQFETCSAEKGRPFIGEIPRYALILGQSVEKKPAPWHGDQIWMAKSSVSLIDRKRGEVLATDTLYFLRYDEHSTACPNVNEQIASLITDVFPEQ